MSKLNVPRIERHIDNIEAQLKEMRYSLKVYKSDPDKYVPQLQNLLYAVNEVVNSAERAYLAIGNFVDQK